MGKKIIQGINDFETWCKSNNFVIVQSISLLNDPSPVM